MAGQIHQPWPPPVPLPLPEPPPASLCACSFIDCSSSARGSMVGEGSEDGSSEGSSGWACWDRCSGGHDDDAEPAASLSPTVVVTAVTEAAEGAEVEASAATSGDPH